MSFELNPQEDCLANYDPYHPTYVDEPEDFRLHDIIVVFDSDDLVILW